MEEASEGVYRSELKLYTHFTRAAGLNARQQGYRSGFLLTRRPLRLQLVGNLLCIYRSEETFHRRVGALPARWGCIQAMHLHDLFIQLLLDVLKDFIMPPVSLT